MKKAIILLAVLALGATVMGAGYAQARGTGRGESMAQKWDYKVLSRARTADYTDNIRSGTKISDWTYAEDGKDIGKQDLVVKLREFGDAGWELISAIPLSAATGDFGGFTSHVIWTFKRPK